MATWQINLEIGDKTAVYYTDKKIVIKDNKITIKVDSSDTTYCNGFDL